MKIKNKSLMLYQVIYVADYLWKEQELQYIVKFIPRKMLRLWDPNNRSCFALFCFNIIAL